jgi:UDP-2-acetamido-2,6-beta-L-arabino-hexul-4-ose reductase
MIKVGVTGSNGFIGWHLCRTLELYSNKFELIEFKRDWFNQNINLDSFISKCDIIVHLAGLNRHNEESAIYNTNVGLAEKF